MKLDASITIRDRIDDLYRSDSRRVFASLVRLLKDFDLADDAMHEAYAAAVEIWQRDGVPANPRAWLISTGKFKAINALRRQGRLKALGIDSSPIVELNRAVAVAMRDGPEAGLVLIDAILERGDLVDYHRAHAARAELCRRSGKMSDAKNSYERALSLARQEPERRFLTRRLSEI